MKLYLYGKCSTQFLIIERKKRKRKKRNTDSGLSPVMGSPIARTLPWSVVDVAVKTTCAHVESGDHVDSEYHNHRNRDSSNGLCMVFDLTLYQRPAANSISSI